MSFSGCYDIARSDVGQTEVKFVSNEEFACLLQNF